MLEFTIKLLMAFDVLIALILIFLILMQKSKSGGGLGGLAGGGAAAEEVLGSGAATTLSRATVIFSVIFLVNTLGLAVLQGQLSPGAGDSILQEEVESATSGLSTDPAVNPGEGTAAETAPAAGETAAAAESATPEAATPETPAVETPAPAPAE